MIERQAPPLLIEANRRVFQYDFEDGSVVVVARGNIPTEEILEALETMIEWKRKELARLRDAVPASPPAEHDPAPAETGGEQEEK